MQYDSGDSSKIVVLLSSAHPDKVSHVGLRYLIIEDDFSSKYMPVAHFRETYDSGHQLTNSPITKNI